MKHHLFLTSTLCGMCGQLHDPAPLPTWKLSPISSDEKTGWAPRAHLDTMEEGKKSLSFAKPLIRPRHPYIFLLGLHKKSNLRQSGTNPEGQVARALRFYTVAPHSCRSSDNITLRRV
jgi:hypothetical protein